jgi:hypothetical protein
LEEEESEPCEDVDPEDEKIALKEEAGEECDSEEEEIVETAEVIPEEAPEVAPQPNAQEKVLGGEENALTDEQIAREEETAEPCEETEPTDDEIGLKEEEAEPCEEVKQEDENIALEEEAGEDCDSEEEIVELRSLKEVAISSKGLKVFHCQQHPYPKMKCSV